MKSTAGALFAVLVASSTVAAGAGSDSGSDAQALALLAKHRAFAGWQLGDGSFRTLRVTGNATDEKGKVTGTFVWLYEGVLFNDRFSDLRRNGVTNRLGFTGNVFWESNYNGFTTPVYGDYARFLASLTLLRMEGTTGLPASYQGHKSVDGKPTEVVRVSLQNGDPIDLYVDPVTGAYVQATIDPDGSYETTYHIRSYQEVVPGKKIISAYTVGDGKTVTTYTELEPNVLISDADLHPPAPVASWTFGDGSPFPFTMTHDRMLVDATINGVKGRFIIDTGADGISLDDRFADRAHAEVLDAGDTAYMLSGAVRTRLRKLQTLNIGNATLQNVVAFSQNFDRSTFDLRSAGYDGLIGFDLFAGAIVRLNVYNSTISIQDPSTDLSSERGLPVTLDLSQGIPIVPMTLDGRIPVNAALDTGSPGLIFLGADIVSKYHFKVLGGCTNINSLSIGPITYGGESACEFGLTENYLLLGFDFLKHFDFVFDYPHGRLFMAPNKN